MIVAPADHQLRMTLPNPGPDGHREPKIKGRAGDRREFTGGNEGRVNRRVPRGVDRNEVFEHAGRGLTAEVEIRVVREIDDRRRIGAGRILDAQPSSPSGLR